MRMERKHVLVVDDNHHITRLLRENLEDCGYAVDVACNGSEAVERFVCGYSPALVITDMVMPKMQGAEAIEAIRSMCPKVKVLAISGGGGKVGDVLAKAKDAGSDAVMAKPFDMGEFERTVASLVG